MSERFDLDLDRSVVKVRTYAKGLLSKLAHDLEIEAKVSTAEAMRDGDRWKGKLVVLPSALKVIGVLKSGRVVTDVLSASDRVEVERKIREEVFGRVGEITIDVDGTGSNPSLKVTAQKTAATSMRANVSERDGKVEVRAKNPLSMSALGLAQVKGPLGAFVVKDDVEIEVELFLSPR